MKEYYELSTRHGVLTTPKTEGIAIVLVVGVRVPP